MNNLIELSTVDDISLNNIKLEKTKNVYIFMKYYNILK